MLNYNFDIYIVACGTLTSIAIDEITRIAEVYNKKVIGIISPIISQVKDSKNVLLLATEATIKKGIFEESLNEALNTNIYKEGCKEFALIVENNNKSKDEIQQIVDSYISKYKDKIDTLICGCTHYGLLKDYFVNTLGNINIIEAGESICNELKEVIVDSKFSLKVFVPKNKELFKSNVGRILNMQEIEFLEY